MDYINCDECNVLIYYDSQIGPRVPDHGDHILFRNGERVGIAEDTGRTLCVNCESEV